MKTKLTLLAFLGFVASSMGQNLITNGSFENPPGTGNSTIAVGTNYFTGWTDGGTGNYQRVTSIPASDGVQWLDLQQSGFPTMQQSFATVIGQQYLLTYDRGVWGAGFGTANPDSTMIVDCGPLSITDNLAATGATAGMEWFSRSYNFTATSALTTLKFTHVDGDFGALNAVDKVAVTPVAVPEPSAALLGGLGVLGLFIRRRR